MILYRGLKLDLANDIIGGTAIAAISNGEFGAGSYYWMESAGDVALYAGVTSALQYYALQHNWAVLKISCTIP